MITKGKGKLSIVREGKHVKGVIEVKNVMIKIDVKDLVQALDEKNGVSYELPISSLVKSDPVAEGEGFGVLNIPCEVEIDRR